jgi:NADPH2:quinone reductase
VIPEVKVNRLLLRNLELIGVSYGSLALSDPAITRTVGRALDELLRAGAIAPIVGARLPLEEATVALDLLSDRRAVGKVVLDVAHA